MFACNSFVMEKRYLACAHEHKVSVGNAIVLWENAKYCITRKPKHNTSVREHKCFARECNVSSRNATQILSKFESIKV